MSLNERGYHDVGKGIKGARTDDELVEAIMDRKHDTVNFGNFMDCCMPELRLCSACRHRSVQ